MVDLSCGSMEATSGFATTIRSHSQGGIDDRGLLQGFLDATFYAQAPEHPGFLAVNHASGPLIPIWTSDRLLSGSVGACRWFSTDGADLVANAPVAHRFVVDPGTPHALLVDPDVFIGS